MDNSDRAPVTFDELRTAIVDRRERLPKRLTQVAAYALAHPDEIAFGTAASIAEAASVQPSTLVRFAQALGFDGFSGLQQVFQNRLRERNASYQQRLRKLETGGAAERESTTILNHFIAAGHASLDTLGRAIDSQAFEQAVDILSGAASIYLLAKRRSYPVASYLAYAFGRLGVRCQLASTAAGIDEDVLALAGTGDAAFAVSFAPYAAETADAARLLAAASVPLVSLTDSALSPLVPCSSVWFELVEADHAGFRSLSASMAFAMALSVSVAEKRRQLSGVAPVK